MLTLRAGQLEADIAPEAGMVVASLRHRGAELLGVRRGLEAYRRSGSTFGVPLLYPFANRLSADRGELIDASAARRDPATGLPIHGLPAARAGWSLDDDEPDRLRATLDWDDPAFAPPHRVEVTHELDAGGLRTTTRIEGDGVPVSFGWHPYLAIDREATEVSVPTTRRLALDERGLPTGAVDDVEPFAGVLGDRTYDDLFEAPAEPFRAGRVTVELEEGAPYAQVYAPPGEPLIAFEPMAAPTNALMSGQGLEYAPYVMRFRIGLA
jgi:aldose 1-epimerase